MLRAEKTRRGVIKLDHALLLHKLSDQKFNLLIFNEELLCVFSSLYILAELRMRQSACIKPSCYVCVSFMTGLTIGVMWVMNAPKSPTDELVNVQSNKCYLSSFQRLCCRLF